MPRLHTLKWGCPLVVALSLAASTASAQYAVGHRTFGIGTAVGLGYSRMDYQFPDVEPGQLFYLLPTLELKVFFNDTISLDMSVPVVNIAASNALQDYFFVTGELYLDFHPTAPRTSWELFAAPGIGVSYAAWKDEEQGLTESGYAFHVPVRVGMEFNNQRRNLSFFVAVRPFFSLVHGGSGDNTAGGGGMLEIGLTAYTVRYRADRY
jgi:hypothetical protein